MRSLLGMMKVVALVALASCSLSSGGDGSPDAMPVAPDGAQAACALGELDGVWRVRFQTGDGDCGPMQDELVMPQGTPYLDDGCAVAENAISDDGCSQLVDFTCGDVRAFGEFSQIDATHVRWLVTFERPTCTGSYAARMTKIRD